MFKKHHILFFDPLQKLKPLSKNEFNFRFGNSQNFRHFTSKFLRNESINILAVGESTTEGRFPQGVDPNSFRYQDQIAAWLRKHRDVNLQTIAQSSYGACEFGDDITTSAKAEFSKADLILLQFTQRHNCPTYNKSFLPEVHAKDGENPAFDDLGVAAQCLEEIWAKSNATLILLDFHSNCTSNLRFVKQYDIAYASVLNVPFDAWHPNEATMNKMVETLKWLIYEGARSNLFEQNRKQTSYNAFNHTKLIHPIEKWNLVEIDQEYLGEGWSNCDFFWTCHPLGVYFEGNVSSKITFRIDFSDRVYRGLGLTFVKSWDDFARFSVILNEQDGDGVEKIFDGKHDKHMSISERVVLVDHSTTEQWSKNVSLTIFPIIDAERERNRIQLLEMFLF